MFKKLILVLAVLAAGFVHATDYDIYVEAQVNEPQFIMQVVDGSTDTVSFHIMSDGTPITATNHTAHMFIDSDPGFGSSRAITATGTVTGAQAVFSMANVLPYGGNNNWNVRVDMRLIGATVPTYSVDGILQIDATPLANSGYPAAMASMSYQSDTNVTTTVTLYTPEYIGQHLYGGAGTGTNMIAEAIGLTTNDWVVITQ